MNRSSPGYLVFMTVNYFVLTVLTVLCVLPILHILAVSLSNSWAATAHAVAFWPVDFTTVAYKETIGNGLFLRAMFNSVERTALGTFISMLVIILAAYPLAKNEHVFKGRSIYVWFFIFPMLFGGGLIPTYLVVMETGLMNTIWALVIPSAMNISILVLMLNFFRSIPRELEDAALIDGAGHFKTILYIYVPVSRPAIATFSLFILVSHWNSWFDGLIYISNAERYPIATFLRSIVVDEDLTRLKLNQENLKLFSAQTIKASQIFIASLPVLIIYPFLQKHFVKGIILGSVKE